MMPRSTGPFPLPNPPKDFAGAQWAPHVFPPFPEWKTVKAPANNIVASPPIAEPETVTSPPAAPTAAPAADKTTHTVMLKTPDGDLSFECPPDMYMLDQTEELDNADDFADLPYACRAGSCSACAGKVVSGAHGQRVPSLSLYALPHERVRTCAGTVDASDCSFLSDAQKADGWVLTCTCKPTSDCVIETHKEDDLY